VLVVDSRTTKEEASTAAVASSLESA